MKKLTFIIMVILTMTACSGGESGGSSAPTNNSPEPIETLPGDNAVELSDLECREIGGGFWALSGQIYGVQLYANESDCLGVDDTFLDMGVNPHTEHDYEVDGFLLVLTQYGGAFYLEYIEL